MSSPEAMQAAQSIDNKTPYGLMGDQIASKFISLDEMAEIIDFAADEKYKILVEAAESYPEKPHDPEDEDDLAAWQEWERAIDAWEGIKRESLAKVKGESK